MEDRIVRVVEKHGPQTGAGLREMLGDDGFGQWKACMRSGRLAVRKIGRRYLRLDHKVEGYARLSPSILREFLTYSMVGLAGDAAVLETRAEMLAERIAEISAAKLKLARRMITEIATQLAAGEGHEEDRFCVLLAGDIVYGMAHDAPRPEKSTGRMVRGSDIDLVVLMDDEAPEELKQRLDDAIYQQKYRCLINPSLREEIDYTIKPLAKFEEQAKFDGFRNMVPCKIMDEAMLLFGSERLHGAARALLAANGVPEKLEAMEREAVRSRQSAERHLLDRAEQSLTGDDLYLFYTSEEREEFE